MEELGDVGHDRALVRHAHVAYVRYFEQALNVSDGAQPMLTGMPRLSSAILNANAVLPRRSFLSRWSQSRSSGLCLWMRAQLQG